MSKRKAFNFYLSYFDTAMMLNNTERLQFYDALMQKQFNGIEPVGLKGGVNFAWVSQKHSIDMQIKGWEDKTGLSLQDTDNQPSQGGSVGGKEPPLAQEQEKEQGKVQEKEKGIEERKKAFGFSLKEFDKTYPKDMLTAFFRYWSEKNKSGTKMKWELEKTFELSLRLSNWAAREKGFDNTKPQAKATKGKPLQD